jgi:hypothetical protein
MFACHHQDSAMVLFTRVYGELIMRSRIQQSLRRCNNPGAFQAHAGAPERQEAARLASEMPEGELVELRKFDTNTFLRRLTSVVSKKLWSWIQTACAERTKQQGSLGVEI